jgi:hypothetical protein
VDLAPVRKEVKRKKFSEAQILLGKHLEELGFREICYEYKFNAERKWQADISAEGPRSWNCNGHFLFECDGGKFRGGHRRGKALEADYERQNWAIINGFKLLRFTNEQVLKGEAKAFIERYL